MKYVFEKGISMPLCAVDNDIYFNYITGQVIDNKSTIKFITRGLKNKSMKIDEYDFKIYKIVDVNLNKTVAYNYEINGASNYLETNKNPLNRKIRQFVIDKLLSGEYIEELIWG